MQRALDINRSRFADWYQAVVRDADMAETSPVRGAMVIKPWGYGVWEQIQQELDRRIKSTGHENCYFPMFIPLSFIAKEAEHVEGFAKEMAVVTHHRLKLIDGKLQPDPEAKLEEPLIVRPTSETIIGDAFSRWIRSHRDLPVLINQWANVVRWEMRTRLFLRTLEFYWQEGHTAHATSDEAVEETLRMLNIYTDFALNEAAVPVIPGRKSETEKFAGAVNSYTIEGMMGDTRALQSGTSHFLGQNFARAFDIQFLDQSNQLQYCWTTSWGLSTRFIGAIIMTHGDDQGLVLPPRLAPVQIVVVPIYRSDEERARVMPVAERLMKELADKRVKLDDRSEVTPGFKFNDWELRGVPLRIEIGPKDVDQGVVTLARRDRPGRAGKTTLAIDQVGSQSGAVLDEIQKSLLEKATAFRDANIHDPKDYDAFKEVVQHGWAFSWWCGSKECEAKIKEDTRATTRCIPFDQPGGKGRCIFCGSEATEKAYFARAY
ncbi:MAG TPA: proline--tRNA ligase [Anaerolineaceae bacterium]|nr:proline--tRNA ligase [Anaerolineaceae bacterium]